jgi:Probable zinc-ribbon domain
MGAGLFSGDPTGDPAGVPCDPECWSEASKQSVAYEFSRETYRDKAYLCWRCGARDVFTAADQKHAFEVRKVNITQERVLCGACHRERVRLDREARVCRRRWAAEGPTLLRDPEFLHHWLAVLEALPGYGGATDEANIAMLRRLVAGNESDAELGATPNSRPP